MHQKNEVQLQEEALKRKGICLYILEKKKIKGLLKTEDFKKIAPNIFVFQRLDIYNEEGPFEYSEMISDQLLDLVGSVMNSKYGWNEKISTSLLTEAGVTEINKIYKDFSRKPTGYFSIQGKFSGTIPFTLSSTVGTE